ncbi:MAG: NTP transferase domain-containing protein [Candidatus Thermoplasmatota archaeon]|nr:NTP transferase domain-containing protein [Candidatus Thermoplasmatota archaeon]
MMSAIILAAGTSSRMGRPKPLLEVGGQRLLERVLEAVQHSTAEEIVVVLGSDADRVLKEVPLDGVNVVVNERYPEGMSTSIRAGIRSLSSEAESALVVLGDQPFFRSETLDALGKQWKATGAPVLIPTFRGVRGNPVLLDRSVFGDMRGITGDRGCRSIFGNYEGEIVEVPVPDPGVLLDIDTDEQLARVAHNLEDGEALETLALELHQEGVGHLPVVAQGSSHFDRSIADDPVDLAQELRQRGEPFVLATVVRAVRPSSGKPGFKAVIRQSGEMTGWIGGACSQSIIVAEALAAIEAGRPRLVRFSPDPSTLPPREGVNQHPMVCESGGEMEIFLDPQRPTPQLLIVGESPLGRALTILGRLLGFRVAVAALEATQDTQPDADVVIGDMEALGAAATPSTYAVVASMGRYDETAVRQLLNSPAPYVGLVASRQRADAVVENLRGEGLSEDLLGRLRNPAGLDLAAETQEEIALSIMAEITEVRHRSGPATAGAQATPPVRETVVDVVCGMTVDPASSLHAEFEGTSHYFCSEGCQTRFVKDPASFLAQ